MTEEIPPRDPRPAPHGRPPGHPTLAYRTQPVGQERWPPSFGLTFAYGVAAYVAITGGVGLASVKYGFGGPIVYSWIGLYAAAILAGAVFRWKGFVAAMFLMVPVTLMAMIGACFCVVARG